MGRQSSKSDVITGRPPLRDGVVARKIMMVLTVAAFMGVVATLVMIMSPVAPAPSHSATETYRVEVLRTSTGAVVLDHEEERRIQLERAIEEGGDVMTIDADVKVFQEPASGVEVSLIGTPQYSSKAIATGEAKSMKMYLWPAAKVEEFDRRDVAFDAEVVSDEVLKQVLPLIGADVAAQSGRADIAAIIEKGGKAPASRGFGVDSETRVLLFFIFTAAMFLLITVQAIWHRAAARRAAGA